MVHMEYIKMDRLNQEEQVGPIKSSHLDWYLHKFGFD